MIWLILIAVLTFLILFGRKSNPEVCPFLPVDSQLGQLKPLAPSSALLYAQGWKPDWFP